MSHGSRKKKGMVGIRKWGGDDSIAHGSGAVSTATTNKDTATGEGGSTV